MNAQTPSTSATGYLDALKRLRHLIDEERAAILTQNAQRLTAIGAEKSAPLRQVEGLLSMMRQGSVPPTLEAQRAELTQLLRECEQGNRTNGALLHSYAARARRLLAPLQAAEASSVYGPRAMSGGRSAVMAGLLQARA